MHVKPIKTIADHRAALQRIDELWDAEPNTPEGDELDVLTTLVAAFEEAEFPIETPDPIEAIRFRMDQLGLRDIDLVEIIGYRSRVSEVMSRKRKLSISMIRRLHTKLNIPAESLIKEYPLAR
ncbi:DNA-binding protein [Pseudidiomarina sp. 1APP75-27a]|uniref:helix-turn-helix domain-containing protein n=1 Tax=Pseudidiomarina terrestris TaxID=2820060 RepID=UPI00264FF16A|nr:MULTISPECIES: DNA-binding protein [unclassified Pseudidiomarina]MDN7136763.1 DNA-binding protein [Pseudidiomarina sp. 1ASP75-14]MEA3587644.1 DNA-binding protein [Pseudidiomarina sp. 1APP75-27a]